MGSDFVGRIAGQEITYQALQEHGLDSQVRDPKNRELQVLCLLFMRDCVHQRPLPKDEVMECLKVMACAPPQWRARIEVLLRLMRAVGRVQISRRDLGALRTLTACCSAVRIHKVVADGADTVGIPKDELLGVNFELLPAAHALSKLLDYLQRITVQQLCGKLDVLQTRCIRTRDLIGPVNVLEKIVMDPTVRELLLLLQSTEHTPVQVV